jgi:signal transduction histidine kinase/CheY-like chemotaxis protein
MCIGRSPDETLGIVLDALPTALSCDLVYLTLPGAPPMQRAMLHGVPVADAEVGALAAALAAGTDAPHARALPGAGELWCLEAEIPLGAGSGRLVAGRRSPLDPSTDRVLVRSAANLVGTALENARILELAHRKDEFLAMLGHELRNPLAPIATAVELLARHPAAAREQKVIERHVRHLARLVDDLLDISRVTRGHVELRSEYVSLASVLERASEIATPLVSQHRHSLDIASADGIVVQGDPVRLAQVFSNLLVNAAKFTPPLGKIDVAIESGPGRVRVTVRDTGRGIARDLLGRIFEPFVQADRERDALHGGLGLGLAIVKNLVERHGGTIAVHSDGPGRGAAFTVELPTVARREEPAPVAPPQASGARANVRVLVVDDNVDIAELLSEALRIEGFQTAIEHDARTALERWRSFVPHAAILDVGLPEIDGYELAKQVRADHGGDPMLIAATGYGQPKDRLRAADAGFDCHFVKPVSVRDLVRVLDQHVVNPVRRSAPSP